MYFSVSEALKLKSVPHLVMKIKIGKSLSFGYEVGCLRYGLREVSRTINTLVNPMSKSENFMLFRENRRLNELSKWGKVEEAQKLFEEMPEKDEFTWNTMIAAYADSGRLVEANQLFDRIPLRSSVSWSVLISGYSKYGYENEAFHLFWQMQYDGQKPTQFTLGSLLRLCSFKGLLVKGEQVHGYAAKNGFDVDGFVITGLVDMYAKCMHVMEAKFLFEGMTTERNHVTWTAMINGYSQNGDALNAMICFWRMRSEGIEANQYTFPGVLTACTALSDLRFGEQVHCCILHGGFSANMYVRSSMVDMYAKCGNLIAAEKLLFKTKVNHAVSWNAMLSGCLRQGLEEQALSFFAAMRQRDIAVDNFTYLSVLNALASLRDVQTGNSMHCLIVKTGFAGYKLVSNALVDMYAKHGNLGSASHLFTDIADKDIISWTSLITGFAHNGAHEDALKFFCDLRNTGIEPDQIVTASVLSSCSKLALLGFGQQVHANSIKSLFEASLSVNNSLVTMYANCGCLENAQTIFLSMTTKNVISWTALIIGYAQNGKGKESVSLYEEMEASGIVPDSITFIGILFACSHAGLVEQGKHYFQSMVKVYGIMPGPDHYACMIDLLGRSGKMQEAEQLIKRMLVEPDAAIWKALLAACREHKKIDLAEKAASALVVLEPEDAVPYIMLSNIYSAAGKWKDVTRIRKLMKSKGIIKEPGYSWIEFNSNVHKFMSGDRSHPAVDRIYSKVDDAMTRIKEAGYMPDMNFELHDINEEGKERGLAYHSEKLAVAFGLLFVPQGAPVRIYKNLRVCGDCHTAMKFISNVFERHIILRDSNCFHHFKQGVCSCGDYW